MAYREAPARPPDPYLVEWADLRRKRRRAWAVPFIFIVAAGCAAKVYEAAAGHPMGKLVFCALFGPLIPLFFTVSRRALDVRCPRCGERFSARRGRRNPSTRKCLHCGIAMGTPKDPTAPRPS
jgi:hypothetical protein